MAELSDRAKEYFKQAAEKYLKNNNVKSFYNELASKCPEELGIITDMLLSNGIALFDYLSEVPSWMFSGSEMETIVIPDHINKIGPSAFYGCKAKQIQLNEGINVILNEAFGDCKNLQVVTIPDTVRTFGKNVFTGCSDQLVLYANKRKPGQRLRCPNNEKSWYKEHLFLAPEKEEEDDSMA